MKNEEFYRRCADLLGTTYECQGFRYDYRTRWNNRAPGHGRFPGYGIIRRYGEEVQVSLRNPICATCRFASARDALAWLEVAVAVPA